MMKVRWIYYLFLVALFSGGCSPSQTGVPEPQGSPLVSPTQGDNSQMTPFSPGLQGLIEKAKEDLAKRLSVAAIEISVAQAGEVVWPDSSLGCPQEGMAYAQVLTPGYLIILEYVNNQYEYHAGKESEGFYCPDPTPPVPGPPGNT
jgi:hypothetical protein